MTGRPHRSARPGRGSASRRPTSTAPEAPDVRLTVERVVAGGDGLAREADGRVVFVPGGLPGEEVDVGIVGAKRDFARSTLRRVLVPHVGRVEPPCPALARGCGGCDWQHADAPTQLELKVEIVREALRRTGGIEDPQVAAVGSVAPWAYRTTMRFALDASGRPGLRRVRSHDVVALDGCLVAHPRIDAMLADLRIPGADEVTLRVSAATGAATVWWEPAAVTPERLPAGVSTGPDATLVEAVGGAHLQVRASAFFQSGPDAANLLVGAVRAAAGDALDGEGRVIDAYGGIGLFARTLVPPHRPVVLVEGSSAACADAIVNLAGRAATVVCSPVEEWAPVSAELVIADPPRQGLGAEAVDRLVATGARTVVLVSCDPVSLARDAGLLRMAGYAIDETGVLDLFPQTHHVEAVTRFSRT